MTNEFENCIAKICEKGLLENCEYMELQKRSEKAFKGKEYQLYSDLTAEMLDLVQVTSFKLGMELIRE